MTTKLAKSIKREVEIEGQAYTVTITATDVTITKKRARSGVSFLWADLTNALRGEGKETPA